MYLCDIYDYKWSVSTTSTKRFALKVGLPAPIRDQSIGGRSVAPSVSRHGLPVKDCGTPANAQDERLDSLDAKVYASTPTSSLSPSKCGGNQALQVTVRGRRVWGADLLISAYTKRATGRGLRGFWYAYHLPVRPRASFPLSGPWCTSEGVAERSYDFSLYP